MEDGTTTNFTQQSEKSTSTRDAAISLAASGMPIFPCDEEKKPKTPKGFYDATTDTTVIETWWEKYGNPPCIGMPAGKITNTLILDVDSEKAKDKKTGKRTGPTGFDSLKKLEEEIGPLPKTRCVRTGGGGYQYHFTYRGCEGIGNSTSLLGPGLDIRGEGGYGILPPSVSYKGKYTWENEGEKADPPQGLIDKIRTLTSRNGKNGGMDPFLGEDGTVIIPDGARDDTLFKLACSMIQKGFPLTAIIAAIEETDRQCAESPGGDSKDDRRAEEIVRRAYKRYERGKLWIASKGTGGLLPFPTGAMPRGCRAFINETAKALDCPVDLVGVAVLAALSSAIGNSTNIRLKRTWVLPASLYLAIINPSGSGKSPAMSAALLPVQDQGKTYKVLYEGAKLEYEARLAEHNSRPPGERKGETPPRKPPYQRTWVDDATVEALGSRLRENWRGLLLFQDEIVGWLRGMDQYKPGPKGNDRQKYLGFHDGKPTPIDRKTSDEPEIVERPFLTICGGIQPSRLHELADNVKDGFFERFLVTYPEQRISRAGLDDEVSQEVEESYHKLIRKIYRMEPEEEETPKTMPLSAEAKPVFERTMNDLRDLGEFGVLPEEMEESIPKFIGYLGRISLILAVSRVAEGTDTTDTTDTFFNTREVIPEDVERAAELVKYFLNHRMKVHNRITTTDKFSKVASELVSYLSDKAEASHSALEWSEILASGPKAGGPQSRGNTMSAMLRRIVKGRQDLSLNDGGRSDGSRVIRISLGKGVGGVGGVGGGGGPRTHKAQNGWDAPNPNGREG